MPRTRTSTSRAAVAVLLLLVFLIAVRPAVDNDLWFHLRTGQWMVDHHRWIGVDPFNHTRPGVARVQTDWIAQLGLYGLWVAGGGTLVALYTAALATAGSAAIYVATRGPQLVRLYVVALSAAASSLFWAARTQMYTFVLTAVTVAALARWRATPRRWWWLVPLFALWANCHGGVSFGVVVVWATVVGELGNRFVRRTEPLPDGALRTLAGVAAACTAVISLNPSGPRIYALPFDQLSSSVRFVEEVQPPSITDAAAAPFFVLLALTVVALVASAVRSRRVDLVEVLLVLGAAVLALRVVRAVSFFATVAAPVLAAHVGRLIEARGGRTRGEVTVSPAFLGVVAAVVAAAVVAGTAVKLDGDRVDERLAQDYPVAATRWLNDNDPPKELFNTFDWGGYLMFFAPEYRVSIDGRTDIYDDYLETYAATIAAEPGWDRELDAEGIGTVLIDTDSPLAGALTGDGGWEVAYTDPVATVFVRRAP